MHNKGLEQFKTDLLEVEENIDFFVSSKMLDGTPRAWKESNLEFTQWRHSVAETLGVTPISVLVVGSARLGYSLNPEKNFKEFGKDSDIDIAIISPEYFEVCWSEIRKLIKDQTLKSHEIGNIRRLVVDRCIPLDIILPHMSFGEKWAKSQDKFIEKLGENFYQNQIAYRVYRDNTSLVDYQKESVIKSIERSETPGG